MLSGISRKRSIRSNPYWFTEFCNSQCLSHFAAPFIVVRAETSVAESCMEALTDKLSAKKLRNVKTTWFIRALPLNPETHTRRRTSAGGAAPRDAQTMDQAAACHHPAAPWRTARGIQSASRNSTSASSHETVGCV